MIEYKIVKYCRRCRKRFTVNKGESKIIFCPECKEKVDKEREQQFGEKK